MPVLAYVVAVRGVAYPGMSGLLHPLLKRWQAGGCGYTAFALPAVQASTRPHSYAHREALCWRQCKTANRQDLRSMGLTRLHSNFAIPAD